MKLSLKNFEETKRSVNIELTNDKIEHQKLLSKLVNFGRWPNGLQHICLLYDKGSEKQKILGKSKKLRNLVTTFLSNCVPENLQKFTLGCAFRKNVCDLKMFIKKLKEISAASKEVEIYNFTIEFEDFLTLIRYFSNCQSLSNLYFSFY